MPRGAAAARVIAILAVLGCCLAAAAYATTRPSGRGSEATGSRPLRPRIVLHPKTVTSEATAEFDFVAQGRPPRRARPGPAPSFECKLDGGAWEACVGPLRLRGIGRGAHTFAVRTVNQAGNESPATNFDWRRTREPTTRESTRPTEAPSAIAPAAPVVVPPAVVVPTPPPTVAPIVPAEEPEEPAAHGLPFTIEQIGSLEDLLPGAPAQPIGVAIDNPNPSPISVSSITASIPVDPPDCPAPENFELTAAALSVADPVVVPAETTLALSPEQDPTIAMLNLPTSQDACQAAELQIQLSGEASG
jgi:hypothetical protein